MTRHVLFYLGAVVSYVVIGLAWAYLRWKRHVDGELDFYDHERRRFLDHHRIRGEDIPEFLKYEWRLVVRKSDRLKSIPPLANHFKSEIAFDMILWPISMIGAILLALFSLLFQRMLAEYNQIADKKVVRLEKDLKG